MTDKQPMELDLTRRLFNALTYKAFALAPNDRPDVVATIEGRTIGVEVTVFHAGEAPNHGGSALRAAEEKIAKDAAVSMYSGWGITNPLPGLSECIKKKIAKAKDYNERRFDELWLLIVGQLPKQGAVISTFATPIALNVELLNQNFNDILTASHFERVYFHLSIGQELYGWSRAEKWQLKSPSHSADGDSQITSKSKTMPMPYST